MQTICVDVADVTVQARSSMLMVTSEVEVGKLVPVKVTDVPPSTVPYLGEIEVRYGVKVEV